MGDKEKPKSDEDESAPAPSESAENGERDESTRSYYYDDATGYEIYREEDESEDDV